MLQVTNFSNWWINTFYICEVNKSNEFSIISNIYNIFYKYKYPEVFKKLANLNTIDTNITILSKNEIYDPQTEICHKNLYDKIKQYNNYNFDLYANYLNDTGTVECIKIDANSWNVIKNPLNVYIHIHKVKLVGATINDVTNEVTNEVTININTTYKDIYELLETKIGKNINIYYNSLRPIPRSNQTFHINSVQKYGLTIEKYY
jgi:hypothetical protein